MSRQILARPLPLLLGASAVLLTAWSLIVPVFEAPDEPAHWQYARHLHDHRTLPLYAPGFDEANSPPLYYALIAPLAREVEGPPVLLTYNAEGALVRFAPPRTFLNTDRDFGRYWPVRAARLVSVVLSIAIVWISYRIGLAATGRADTALLTALLVLLLPQFSFRSVQISNDVLVTLFGAATILGVVRLLDAFTWTRAIVTSVALGAAYLSKISAIALLVPVSYALGSRRGPLRDRVLALGALGVALVLVLPWSLRNIALYGDPFASGAMRTAVAHIITDRPLLSPYFVTEFPRLLIASFVGYFGWMSVPLPMWFYGLYFLLFAIAACGLLFGLWRGTVDRRLALALVLAVLSALAVVVHINRSFTQPQGRYLFSVLPAVALLCALGLEQLRFRGSRLVPPVAVAGLLGALNLFALVGVVWPAYYPPVERDLPGGDRLIFPARLNDLAVVGSQGVSFTVIGREPSWSTPVEAPAGRYNGVVLEMSGVASPPRQRGCIRFATAQHPLADTGQACFVWTADGSPQKVLVPLADRPGWQGTITLIQVHPFADAERVQPGWRVDHGAARLAYRSIATP